MDHQTIEWGILSALAQSKTPQTFRALVAATKTPGQTDSLIRTVLDALVQRGEVKERFEKQPDGRMTYTYALPPTAKKPKKPSTIKRP